MLEKYNKWTLDFMESWKALDWEKTLTLLDKNVEYYENPIDKPCSSFEEVKELWKVVEKNQRDVDYTYEIVAYNEKYCIINWQMTRTLTKDNTKQQIDGIFQISINNKGLCTYFKQWRYVK